MPSLYPRLSLVAGVTLLLLAGPALASKPDWIPIAQLLVGSIGEADPVRMSAVMTRCTALHMTLAGMTEEISPLVAQQYRDEALSLLQQGVYLDLNMEEQKTGVEGDIPALSDAAIEKVRALLTGYGDWLDDNLATGGSYFTDEFETEMDSCRLATRMVKQMLVE